MALVPMIPGGYRGDLKSATSVHGCKSPNGRDFVGNPCKAWLLYDMTVSVRVSFWNVRKGIMI